MIQNAKLSRNKVEYEILELKGKYLIYNKRGGTIGKI